MREKAAPRPTDAELAILRVLWQRGPATVREVHEDLSGTQDTGYTTVLKILQIMTEKGLVVRSDDERTHVSSPKVPAERTQRQMVRDLMDRVFGGSVQELVLQALGSGKVSAAELREIKKLLNKMES